MKIYLLQSAPNNIIWEIIFIDTDYWLFNRYGLNHQLHQFVYVHLLCRMALKQYVIINIVFDKLAHFIHPIHRISFHACA